MEAGNVTAKYILEALSKYQLSTGHIVSQGYDGASVMSDTKSNK